MEYMEELKDMLCDELEQITEEGITVRNLDMIDKLTHSIKSIDTILAMGKHNRNGGSFYSRGHSSRKNSRNYGLSEEGNEQVLSTLENIMNETKDGKVKEAIKGALEHIDK